MRTGKGLITLAGALAAVIALPSAAQAATTVKLGFGVTPGKSGTTKKPKPAKIVLTINLGTDDGTSPPTAKSAVVSLAKGLRFNLSKFPACSRKTLDTKGVAGCPKGSKVGSGSATAAVGGTPGKPLPTLTEVLKITAFNGTGGKTLLLFLDGTTPAPIQQALVGRLAKASGAYGYKLTLTIPGNLQQPLPGLFAPLTIFKVTVGATVTKKGKKVGYIETTSCPRSKVWPFSTDLAFANDVTPAKAPAKVTCR